MSDYIETWDEYFFRLAALAARKSKDDSTKVGCVVVNESHSILTTGFNGFPRGVDESIASRWERPEKYEWIEHAERNAVDNAACEGIRLKGSTMYTTIPPCTGCARAIAQAGIKEVVVLRNVGHGKGAGTFYNVTIGEIILKERGVIVRDVEKTWSTND